MSPLFLLCVLFLTCSVASRSHDFTLCKACSSQRSAVISTVSQYMRIQDSLSYLHSLPCLNLCFNRKVLPIPRSEPTFKLAIILLLAGDVSLNPGPDVRRNIRVATTNVRSIRDKIASLTDLLISKKIDILAVTETWLRPHDTAACIADISPSGFTFHHRPRSVGRGGGVGFLIAKQFKVNLLSNPEYSTFESICVDISHSSFSGYFVCIYRPPGHPANFFEEFQDLLENLATMHSEFYIVGDFNLHLDIPSATTTTFNDILASFDTKQHVTFPTHIHGHWLDLLITRSTCENIRTPTVSDGLSDHHTVIADLKVSITPAVSKHNVFYRSIYRIDIAALMTDILKSDLITHPKKHVSDMYEQYYQVLKALLNKHAPIKSKSVSQKPPAPWMTPEIIKSKRRRRYLERVWRKSRSSLDRSRYSRQCHFCNRQMATAKSEYYANMVSKNSGSPHQLWNCINQILHRRPAPSLPNHTSVKSLCESFSNHFKNKISLIRSAFPGHTSSIVNADCPQVKYQLASFEPATVDEVRTLIMSSPNKSCDLDPFPTILLKTCLEALLKPITDIINASLCSGFFPDDFKHAHVNPVLKKTSLTKEDLNSYRPISNLSFISKILEKVVAKRLRSHISTNDLSNVFQSAYKQFHSTETALLKVHNDINLNIDKGKVTALTLLDLSAAFDTIDHSILIKRLALWYGISGRALNWFSSYLTDRHQAIKIGNCFSAVSPTSCGVPQGSVLGPLLFTLYTTPLSFVIQSHNLEHHLYADDTQIYISLATPDTNRSLNQLSDCLQDIFHWMNESKLKLNADKTEFLIIGTPKQRRKLDGFFPTRILSQSITPAASARNLGVTFDENFNFNRHISKTCRCCFYHIRDLRRIRRYISLSVAKTIATALVSSRLDYCNSLLYNIAGKDITKLQRVQNCLARVVTRSPRFSRSVPLLKSLHWLPVRYRIIFKICTIAYQALSFKQPAYLHSMLTPARNPRQLRSTSCNLLFIPRVKTNAGTRAFSVAAPTLWNSLPASVKLEGNIVSFRRRLKTYLFNIAYPP